MQPTGPERPVQANGAPRTSNDEHRSIGFIVVSHSTVSRGTSLANVSPRRNANGNPLVDKAWRRAGLQPHRFQRYMRSDDPDFETKAADVIGLYVNPPDHAAVFAVDEKPRFKRSRG